MEKAFTAITVVIMAALQVHSDEVILKVKKDGGVLCEPCSQLHAALGNYLKEEDLADIVVEKENGSIRICCLHSLDHFLALIDSRLSKVSDTSDEYPVSLHVVLEKTGVRKSPLNYLVTDIVREQWSSTPDYAYCYGKGSFCHGFYPAVHGNHRGISLPKSGVYHISCELAWRPLMQHESEQFDVEDTLDFKIQVSRRSRGHARREVLAMDHVTETCNTTTPCAFAGVQRTLRLRKHDQIFIGVTHKGLLINEPPYSYLQILKLF